jgi:FkbM family methyltransferase
MSTFIQIGTNDGNDEFLIRVKKDKPDLVILIEPNRIWNDIIRKNYEGVAQPILLNIAITEQKVDSIKLYIPKVNNEGLAKNGYGYGSNNFSILPMDDWGNDLVELEVVGRTLMDLCEQYGIHTIDFLAIDTEGYDAQIIKSIDFSRLDIKEIEYEIWDFPEDAFTRHGDKKKEYGVNGTRIVNDIFAKAGYTIERSKIDSMNRIAKKI